MAEQNGGFLKGLLLGGTIGAVLALLYAPKSGREMREDIKRSAEGVLNEVEGELDKIQKKAEEAAK